MSLNTPIHNIILRYIQQTNPQPHSENVSSPEREGLARVKARAGRWRDPT
jgi:hypothetical protein